MKAIFEVESVSHRVSEAALRLFEPGVFAMEFRRSSDFRFSVEIDTDLLEGGDPQHREFHAYKMASMFLFALNVATIGYFWWAAPVQIDETFQVLQPGHPPRAVSLSRRRPRFFENVKDLADLDLENALIIWAQLVRDPDDENWKGYQKGLMLLTAEHIELDFHREAFGNFYRCIEAFVTRKVLRVRRLHNEVRQVRQALQQIGAEQALLDAFADIYAIRSGQVAHAQNEQREITFDEVLVTKAFADMFMYSVYRQEAEALRGRQ